MQEPLSRSDRALRFVHRAHRWLVTGAGYVCIFLFIEKFWPKSVIGQFVRAVWP